MVTPPNETWQGLSFAEVARKTQQDPLDFFIEALQLYDTDLRWVATGANDRLEPRKAMMSHPHILPGFTDAGAHVRNLGYYNGALSLLKQAVVTKFIKPETAISRVTGEPAQWFRLDTGTIKIGAKADIVIINPNALNQPISPQIEVFDPVLDGEPRMVKRGSEEIIQSVYISGIKVIDQGKVTRSLGKQQLGTILSTKS